MPFRSIAIFFSEATPRAGGVASTSFEPARRKARGFPHIRRQSRERIAPERSHRFTICYSRFPKTKRSDSIGAPSPPARRNRPGSQNVNRVVLRFMAKVFRSILSKVRTRQGFTPVRPYELRKRILANTFQSGKCGGRTISGYGIAKEGDPRSHTKLHEDKPWFS